MRIHTKVVASAALTVLLLAMPAAAQVPPTPPPIPNLNHLPGAVERFQLTVRGTQLGQTSFTWDPAPGSAVCSLYSEGGLTESWQFQRGKAVTMEFRKLGGTVVIGRKGRPLGDTAFAAPGTVTRLATGYYQAPNASGCPTFGFDQADCGKALAARSDLRLEWSNGMLRLKESGPAAQNKNPAENCGLVEGAVNFGSSLASAYPILLEQRAKLPSKRIFKSKRSIALTLKPRFLAGVNEPNGFTKFTEKLTGSTVVTLKRL